MNTEEKTNALKEAGWDIPEDSTEEQINEAYETMISDAKQAGGEPTGTLTDLEGETVEVVADGVDSPPTDGPPQGAKGLGDKDPKVMEWYEQNDPDEFERRYAGRKTHLS